MFGHSFQIFLSGIGALIQSIDEWRAAVPHLPMQPWFIIASFTPSPLLTPWTLTVIERWFGFYLFHSEPKAINTKPELLKIW